MSKDSSDFEKNIGVAFKNKDFLKEALTHRSYLNEHPEWAVFHNERLEYLGDAVLELVTTEYLFHFYPNYQEGELTSLRAALVNYQMMAKVAREISLEQYLFLSKGEAKDSGKAREVILANALESLIGAIYLDHGYDVTKTFIERFIISHLREVVDQKLYRDPKSVFQEIMQEKKKVTPTYRVLRETGPDHQKQFLVGVFLDEELVAQGQGTSKQEAESSGAKAALELFGLESDK
ncbi:MAG: ribonuclease III [Patescibacteria group bacterium]